MRWEYFTKFYTSQKWLKESWISVDILILIIR